MAQSFGSLYFHLVFSTKYRAPRISEAMEPHLYSYFGGILSNHNGQLIAAGGMPDHVHLLVSLSRTVSIADTHRTLKSNSSSWIRGAYAHESDFAWQKGYGAFSVSFSALDAVRRYIANQKERHAKQSFQDEFRELLRLHELTFDENFIWE